MAGLRLYYDSKRAEETLIDNTARAKTKMLASLRATALTTAAQIEDEARADIQAAGNFGENWQDSLRARITEGGGNIKVGVTSTIPYFNIYQYGGVIKGKPLLWIPLSYTGIKDVWASQYPGRLVRVNRKSGPPILLDTVDRQAKYVGLASVRMPKKFHILEIVQAAAAQMAEKYRKYMASGFVE